MGRWVRSAGVGAPRGGDHGWRRVPSETSLAICRTCIPIDGGRLRHPSAALLRLGSTPRRFVETGAPAETPSSPLNGISDRKPPGTAGRVVGSLTGARPFPIFGCGGRQTLGQTLGHNRQTYGRNVRRYLTDAGKPSIRASAIIDPSPFTLSIFRCSRCSGVPPFGNPLIYNR